MATRIYTKVSGAVGVTPSTWNFAAQINPVTVPGTTTKNDASTMTSKTETISTTNPHNDAFGRTIYGPLETQTISGTVKGQMRGSENNAGCNATLGWAIKVVQPGGTDRGVCLAQTASDAATAGNELVVTTLTNIPFRDAAEAASLTLASQDATRGDYLVIEWGVRTANATGSRTVTLSYGNDSATDLAEDTTTTAADNPWWEFSGTISLAAGTGNAAQTQGNATCAAQGTLHNLGYPFTAQTSVTIPGTTHGAGHADLLVQVYDAAAPRALIEPGRVTIDPTTFDIVVTFRQAQSGLIVVNGGNSVTTSLGNYASAFTAQTGVTLAGTTHLLGTPNLLVEVYDTSSPPRKIQPGRVTVDGTSFDVTVTFRQAQSGTILLCAAAAKGTAANYSTTFSAQTTVSVPNSSHGRNTDRLLVQVMDTASPALRITPGQMTVTAGTGDIVLTFRQAQSGKVIVSGSAQVITGTLTQSQGAETNSAAGALALQAVLAQTQASQTISAAATLPLAGVSTPTQAAATVTSAGSLPVVSTATPTQASSTGGSAAGLTLSGIATLTQSAQASGSSSGVALVGTTSRTQDSHTIATSSANVVFGTATLIQADATVASAGGLALQAQLGRTQGTQGTTSASVVALLGTGALTAGNQQISAVSAQEIVNYAAPFTTQTTVTIPGTTHLLGHPNLLIEVYDASLIPVRIQPARVTVDGTSFDVTVTFRQAQSGTVILCGGNASSGVHGNYGQTFVAVSSVTVSGGAHQLQTANLLVQVYDNSTPARQIDPGRVTVQPGTFDVVVTFRQPQSGRIVLGGYAATGGLSHVAQSFTTQTTVSILGATHGLATPNLLLQVYDSQSPRQRLTPGRVTVDPTTFDVVVSFSQPQSGTVVLNGSLHVLSGSFLVQANESSASTSVLTLAGAVTAVQANASVTSAATLEHANYGQTLAGATSVTILGTTHQAGTPNLLVQVWDSTTTPWTMVTPGDITVDATTFDVTVSFLQAMTGRVVLNAAKPVNAVHANAIQAFTNQSTVTVLGATHRFASTDVLVQVYNAASPQARVEPASVTVDPSSFDVVVTLLQTMNGVIVVNGWAVNGSSSNPAFAFTAQTSVTIPGVTHGLATANLLTAVYDTATPAHALMPDALTVDPATYDVTVTFLQAQSGVLILNGSNRGAGDVTVSQTTASLNATGALALQAIAASTQAAQAETGTSALALAGTLARTQATGPVTATGGIVLTGAGTPTQAAAIVTSASVSAIRGAAPCTQGNQAATMLGAVTLQGAATPSQAGQAVQASTGVAGQGSFSLTQASATSVGAGTLTLIGLLIPTQAAEVVSVAGTLPLLATTALAQAANQRAITGTINQPQGAAVMTQEAPTLTTDGSITLTAAAIISQGNATLTVTSDVAVQAAAAVIQAPATLVSSSSLSLQGTSTPTTIQGLASQGATTLSGSLTQGQVAGTSASTGTLPLVALMQGTQELQSLVASTGVGTQGQVGLTQTSHLVSANTGTETLGTGQVVQATATVTATGTAPRNGTGTLVGAEAASSATGAVTLLGTSILTQAAATIAASTGVIITGLFTQAAQSQAVTGASQLAVQGVVSQTQPNATVFSAGTLNVAGLVAVAATNAMLASAASLTLRAAGSPMQESDSVTASTSVISQGSIALIAGAQTGTGTAVLTLTGTVSPLAVSAMLSSTGRPVLQAEGVLTQTAAQMISAGQLPLEATVVPMPSSQASAGMLFHDLFGAAALAESAQNVSANAGNLATGRLVLTQADASITSGVLIESHGTVQRAQLFHMMTSLTTRRWYRSPGGAVHVFPLQTRVPFPRPITIHGSINVQETDAVSA